MKIFSHFMFALHFLAVSAIIRDKFILNIYDRILRVFKKTSRYKISILICSKFHPRRLDKN